MPLVELSQRTIKLIKSSQVISSITSIVKELIENSLDAGGTVLSIKLENFGFEKLEVKDNGHGIKEEDILYIAKPHFTSKLQNFEDLDNLSSYGFRGEALSSLCAIADVLVNTKNREASHGFTYSMDTCGDISSKKPAAVTTGTSIIVKNLFKNIPVRRQYYSNNRRKRDELKKIENIIMAFAIIKPSVHITFTHEKCIVFQKPSSSDFKTAVHFVFRDLSKHLIYKEQNFENVHIRLWLPRAEAQGCSLSSCDRLFIFVNDRPVSHKTIEKLIKAYYSQKSEGTHGRYPIGAVIISLPPNDIDVNLEPNKTKIYFKDEKYILSCIQALLSDLYGEVLQNINEKASSENLENVLPCTFSCTQLKISSENEPMDAESDSNYQSKFPVKEKNSRDLSPETFGSHKAPTLPCHSEFVVIYDHKPVSSPQPAIENKNITTNFTTTATTLINNNEKSKTISNLQTESNDSRNSTLLVADNHSLNEYDDINSINKIDYHSNFNQLKGEKDQIIFVNQIPMEISSEALNRELEEEQRTSNKQLGGEQKTPNSQLVGQQETPNRQIEGEQGTPNKQFKVGQGTPNGQLEERQHKAPIRQLEREESILNEQLEGEHEVLNRQNQEVPIKQLEIEQQALNRCLEGKQQALNRQLGEEQKTPNRQLESEQEIPNRHFDREQETRNRQLEREQETPNRQLEREQGTPNRQLEKEQETPSRKLEREQETPNRLLEREQEAPRKGFEGEKEAPWSRGHLFGEKGNIQSVEVLRPPEVLKDRNSRADFSSKRKSSDTSNETKNSPIKSKKYKISISSIHSEESIAKPESAFSMFAKSFRKKVIEENPGANFTVIALELAKRWRNADLATKQVFEERALEMKNSSNRLISDNNISLPLKPNHEEKSLNLKCLSSVSSSGNNLSQTHSKSKLTSVQKVKPWQQKSLSVSINIESLTRKIRGKERMKLPTEAIIGNVKGINGWIYRIKNCICAFNTSRMNEIILYRSLVESFIVPVIKLEDPIPLNQSNIGIQNWEILLSLNHRSSNTHNEFSVLDQRINSNGFKVVLLKGAANTNIEAGEITHIADSIPNYGIVDLQEILHNLFLNPMLTIQGSRPSTLHKWFKDQSMRMGRAAPHIREVSVLVEKLNKWHKLDFKSQMNVDAKCLHGMPIFKVIKTL